MRALKSFMITRTLAGLAFGTALFGSTLPAHAGDCVAAASIVVPGIDYRATAHTSRASRTDTGLEVPAHCRLEGEFERRTGADGKEYAIRFALLLPDDWNGRFLFQGGGGLNGVLHEPYGARFAGDSSAISQGFAVVSTDSGHQASTPFDPAFMADQEALLNFLYRANEKVTVLAKGIVSQYYGRSDFNAYFVGCSTGGREAMMMSQRYPWLYEGIVAGAPAMRTNLSELGDTWVAAQLRARNPDGSSGEPLLDATAIDTVLNGVLNACDALDGMQDEMIFNTAACGFDPQTLACTAEATENCLSQEQAAALSAALAGPKDARGFAIYTPFPYDGGIADGKPGERAVPGLLHAVGGPLSGRLLKTRIDWDAEAVAAANFPLAFGNTSEFQNLSSFQQRGGKLIFYHGMSDPWFSALDTVRYYNNLSQASGGAAATADWSRLFLAPGVGHCAGGSRALDQIDLLAAIVDWVEQDQAPQQVEATGVAFPGRSRPLCPYPAYARYNEGDPDKADSYVCALAE